MKWVIAVVVALLAGIGAFLLLRDEDPRPQPAAPAGPTPTNLPIASGESAPPIVAAADASSDEVDNDYLRRVQTADIRRALQDPDLPASVSDFLLDQGLPATVHSLEELAQLGDASANIALVRLELYCSNRDPLTIRRGELVPGGSDRGARVPPPPYFAGCSKALFDRPAIETRLRQNADAAHTPSLLVLGYLSEDAARRRLWTSAAILGDPQAQLALSALLRRDTATGRIGERAAFWLNAAAKNINPARVALASCRAAGCEGKPADERQALELLREAAQLGDEEAFALLLEQAPATSLIGPEERYASFALFAELWRHGCYGSAPEIGATITSPDELLRDAEKRLSPSALQKARELAAAYQASYLTEAKQAQRCT